jgi:hypothetical protein
MKQKPTLVGITFDSTKVGTALTLPQTSAEEISDSFAQWARLKVLRTADLDLPPSNSGIKHLEQILILYWLCMPTLATGCAGKNPENGGIRIRQEFQGPGYDRPGLLHFQADPPLIDGNITLHRGHLTRGFGVRTRAKGERWASDFSGRWT